MCCDDVLSVPAKRSVLLAAVLALVPPRLSVTVYMHLQGGLPLEGLAADRADKRVLCLVHLHMANHVCLLREAHLADLALEGLLVRVAPHVQRHLGAPSEPHVALGAGVSLLAVVLLRLVATRIHLVREPLQADVAGEGLEHRIRIRTFRLLVPVVVVEFELDQTLWTHVELDAALRLPLMRTPVVLCELL